jgi:hypothetical protein
MENLARLVSETLARNGFEVELPSSPDGVAKTATSTVRVSATASGQNRQALPQGIEAPAFPAGF